MSRRQLPRTTAAILDAATFLPGEIAVDTTNDELRYDGDGSTVGGIAVARKDGTNLTASPSLVTATGTTTARTLAARFADALNLKDFGAVGDGVTDDTVAVQAWIEACRNNAKIGFAPDGDYLCDALTFGPLVQANTPGLYGTDANTCRFIKKTNNSSPLITFNSSAATTYLAGMTIQNIGFVGGSSGPVVRSYSMVRSEFIGCEMTGGSIGVEQFGGIGMEYANCGIHGNGINLKIRKYTASIGTGYPNLTTVTGGYITNATTTNVDFDDGKRLELHGVDVEGAVTNILVGANIGSEDSVESYGVVVFGGWIEAATGTAAVSCASGLNCFYAAEVAANSATYDFSFSGGRYVLRDLTGPTSKSTSVNEGGSIGSPNLIENVKLGGAITVDGAKTAVILSNGIVHTQLPGLLRFLGATSSFPALKRSGTTIQARLADDSGFASLQALALTLSNALPLASGGTGIGSSNHVPTQLMFVATGVNMNSANTDTAIPITLPAGYTRFLVNAVRVWGASGTLNVATCGVFTAAAAGGTAIVGAGSTFSITTASEGTNNNALQFNATNATTQSYLLATVPNIYFRVGTAQGSATTANVGIIITPLV